MEVQGYWIWRKQRKYVDYNQTILARRSFTLATQAKAQMAITADSQYRLYVNGRWVNDGPCRSWPEHYQYDVLDLSAYLQPGVNNIEIVARFFGDGNFHQIPQQAGLLVHLEVVPERGQSFAIVSDSSWEVADAKPWVHNTPGVSIQMEPSEQYNALQESAIRFTKAVELFPAHDGPWGDLNPRDCALLTRQPVHLERFYQANVVQRDWCSFTFPIQRILHPGLIAANHNIGAACFLATIIHSPAPMRLRIESPDFEITVNGKRASNTGYTLQKGRNLLLAHPRNFFMGHVKDKGLRFVQPVALSAEEAGVKQPYLLNPIKPAHHMPWCVIPLEEGRYVGDDLVFFTHTVPEREQIRTEGLRVMEALRKEVASEADFQKHMAPNARQLKTTTAPMTDPHWQFLEREVIADGGDNVRDPIALMYDNSMFTEVTPHPNGDVELVYDLGVQRCGYLRFDLIADAETVVDIFEVEHITPEGVIQHTYMNRNGLRYVCKQGVNRFTSLKRRSGRYVFLTIRNQQGPVQIRKVEVIESTYPVPNTGWFQCSNSDMDRIWEISARTLRLCMEDSFTDCPLYEQTLWVGDARNEALFNYTAYGVTDITKRCINIAGQSLERYPIVGCQVPSSWDCLLPAWSFLWGIMVWDYYYYTGDQEYLADCWGDVKKNLAGAEGMLDENGLFTGKFWNMFDWIGIDDQQPTVLHNSMFLVGAIDAALACAKVLKDAQTAKWLRKFRAQLVKAINSFWLSGRGAYPDSIHEDGKLSPQVCQHTSFLAILYDIIPEEHFQAALKNVLYPAPDVIPVGSPFAILYLYEMFEKLGLDDAILDSILDNYLPMLEEGASTVWEVFPGGTGAPPGFPTRSHCHAWSSAPVYFLNRILLGIRATQPGGQAYAISPHVTRLNWAKGASAGYAGPVEVTWEKQNKQLNITAKAPRGVRLSFKRNATHEGLSIRFNGKPVK